MKTTKYKYIIKSSKTGVTSPSSTILMRPVKKEVFCSINDTEVIVAQHVKRIYKQEQNL